MVLAAALAVRLLYLAHAVSRPGYHIDDPDSYLRQAERIARGPSGWAFDFDVVEHAVEGRRYALPPLYPVFLSVFAALPGFPLNALVGQAFLAVLGCFSVFLIGRGIHSERAGLIGAALYALWFPNVIAVWSTMQETVFVPLLLAGFAMLVRAKTSRGFALAGLLFGLAALTRSMPVYYMPVAVVLLVGREGLRRGAVLSAALLLGFAAITVPYSVALSSHLGSATFIENHAGLRIASQQGVEGARPPGPIATGLALARGFAEAPRQTLSEWSGTALSILHVNGGRLLQIYLGAGSKAGSVLWKTAVHVLSDFALVLTLALAPFGLVLCRRPDRAWFLAAWIVVAFGLTVLSGFGGPRLRAPFEPHLMVGAAVVLASGWARPRAYALGAAAVVSIALLAAVLPQLGRSLAARGDYGVDWPLDALPKRSAMTGQAGFNVLASDGFAEFAVRPRNEGKPVRVSIFIDGTEAGSEVVDAMEHWFRYPAATSGLVFVELRSEDAESGSPARMLLVVPK
jgi:4-amino-4-deoxy-L-arabinose transferase-like glycosyltransferase